MKFLWHGYCLMGIQMCPIPWDVSHGIPIGMIFLWTSLGAAPSINYRTEKDTDWQKLRWFLVFHIQIWGVESLFGGLSSEFWVSCDNVAAQLGGMESGWHGSRSWYRGNSEQRNIFTNWNNLFSECSEHV